jgi:hypothetical protein
LKIRVSAGPISPHFNDSGHVNCVNLIVLSAKCATSSKCIEINRKKFLVRRMEKHKQRVSVPKVKETLEGKRLQSRLNSLQLSKDRSEDIGDDENANVGHLTNYSRSNCTT